MAVERSCPEDQQVRVSGERRMEWVDFTDEARAELRRALESLQVNSYGANALRGDNTLLSGRRNLGLEEALKFIEAWVERGSQYCERILRAPRLHAPYIRYLFNCLMEEDHVSILTTLITRIGEEEYRYGEMDLFVYRLKHERYLLRYSDEADWEWWVNDVERVGRTPVEELRAAGEIVEVGELLQQPHFGPALGNDADV